MLLSYAVFTKVNKKSHKTYPFLGTAIFALFVLTVSLLTGSENQWTTSWWEQFKVLLRRGLKERKHESYSGLRIFQVISVSVLSGLLWWRSDTSNIQDQV